MMRQIAKVMAAVEAASNLSPAALAGHVRRRLRNRIVPLGASAYRAGLERRAAAFSAFRRDAKAIELAGMVARCFEAEYRDTIPGCYDGRFDILNRRFDFGSLDKVDWRFNGDEGDRQIRRANLAQFGFVPAAALRDPARALAMAAQLTESFLATADFSNGSDFSQLWHPYIASRRLLALNSALLITPGEFDGTEAFKAVESFVRLNAAFVLGNLETELGFNHLERNLAALGLFGLARDTFPDAIASALRAQYQAIVVHSIGEDGVQKERSAMYQGLTVQSLRIFSGLPIWSEDQNAMIKSRLLATERALAALTLGDDQPVLFNDGWLGEAPPSSSIVVETPPGFTVMRDAGYVRLAGRDWVAVLDAGAIGPDENPGHGHPDFLSVEASFAGHRLLVDPGTFSYSAGSARDELRAWTAHNGPAFVGPLPVAFLGSFKVGRRAAATIVEAVDADGVQEATGQLAFDRYVVTRSVRLSSDGRLEIADRWAGEGDTQTRFLVPGDWRIEQQGDELSLRRDETILRLRVEGGQIAIGTAKWSRYYDVLEDAHEIVLRPDGSRLVAIFEPV
ncbi:heparinase II/III-family protein [Mesorhizobium sp. KR9-304]|uniref:heparinase II/III-family protein n=1 Tax=Mesorhizobium sp. KR9-304 TaxID=3156614 RepID=UPI0032B48080